MKRKLIFLVAVTFFITTVFCFTAFNPNKANAALAVEKVSSTDAVVAVDALNMRQGPAVAFPVIGKLEKGHSLKVLSKIGNWFAVYDLKNGSIGAVDGKYIKFDGDAQASLTGLDSPSIDTNAEAMAPTDLSQDEQALLDLVNKARKDAGLDPLTMDKDLLKTARLKAKDMVDNNYFSHQSPSYDSPFDMMRKYNISFKTAGENIAGNQTVEGAFKAWMKSDGHKKNILNSGFNYIGIGIETSKTYGKILVQQFVGR